MQIIRSIFMYFSIFFGGIYLLYLGYVYFNQGEMIFMANKLPKNYKFEFNQDFEELNISSVYNICFLLEDGTPIIILVCVNDNCRGRFII